MPAERLIVTAIDVGYLGVRGAGAAFAVSRGDVRGSRVLVETGPAVCLPALEAGLRAEGIDPARIADVLVTHVHLDHAGAAGHFAAHGAHVWVHPRGARHLVDPGRLVAGTRAVHGIRFESEYGMPKPVDAPQVHAVEDGASITCDAGGVVTEALATPGHARHHHAWVMCDAQCAHIFTGDVAGILLPEGEGCVRRFLAVPMPPTDMDVVAWRDSIARLESVVDAHERDGRSVILWLTHGGAAADARAHLRELRERLEEEHALCATMCGIGLVPDGVPSSEAVERYAQWLWPRADAAGVRPKDRAAFLGHAFMRMNLAGVAHERSRGTV
jgi:glyoxylase-like metal-dependent hydrolase (beta-lactamase superfamily II)